MGVAESSLQNRVLAITRGEYEADEFLRLVNAEGGRAIAVPAIEVVPEGPEAARAFVALLKKKKHDYCAFMSAQAVKVLFDLVQADEVTPALESTSVIAVGPRTKQELEKHGIRVETMPESYSSVGLVELLTKRNPKGKKIIIPRSGEANEFAVKALSYLGMDVDEIYLYSVRTVEITQTWKEFYSMLAQKKVDAVVFTSASNVRSFFEITEKLGGLKLDDVTKVVSIGPLTSAELEMREVKYSEAQEHTVEGTVQVAKELFRTQG